MGIILANMAILFWHNDILVSALALLAPVIVKTSNILPRGTFTRPRDLLFERFGLTGEDRLAIWADGGYADIVALNLGSWFNASRFSESRSGFR